MRRRMKCAGYELRCELMLVGYKSAYPCYDAIYGKLSYVTSVKERHGCVEQFAKCFP